MCVRFCYIQSYVVFSCSIAVLNCWMSVLGEMVIIYDSEGIHIQKLDNILNQHI